MLTVIDTGIFQNIQNNTKRQWDLSYRTSKICSNHNNHCKSELHSFCIYRIALDIKPHCAAKTKIKRLDETLT